MRAKKSFICTERLRLEPLSDGDKKEVIALFLNDEIKKTFMVPDFKSPEEAEVMFEHLNRMSASDSHFIYGVKLTDKLIGIINDTDVDGSTIEVGYVIHPDMKNKGYATEALRASIHELFRIGFSVVKAGAFEENTASRRVMEKCGMKPTDQVDYIEYRGKTHRCVYNEIKSE